MSKLWSITALPSPYPATYPVFDFGEDLLECDLLISKSPNTTSK